MNIKLNWTFVLNINFLDPIWLPLPFFVFWFEMQHFQNLKKIGFPWRRSNFSVQGTTVLHIFNSITDRKFDMGLIFSQQYTLNLDGKFSLLFPYTWNLDRRATFGTSYF